MDDAGLANANIEFGRLFRALGQPKRQNLVPKRRVQHQRTGGVPGQNSRDDEHPAGDSRQNRAARELGDGHDGGPSSQEAQHAGQRAGYGCRRPRPHPGDRRQGDEPEAEFDEGAGRRGLRAASPPTILSRAQIRKGKGRGLPLPFLCYLAVSFQIRLKASPIYRNRLRPALASLRICRSKRFRRLRTFSRLFPTPGTFRHCQILRLGYPV
jgi:hypothetical protein